MSNFPKLPNQFSSERKAVLKVALLVNERGHIFRETPHTDVGLDGQIEYVNSENEVTGQLVAVQIKYGDSYLKDKGDHWAYYPQHKHISYWANYPVPVFIFVYSPINKCTYYANIQEQLIKSSERKAVKIFKNNIFELTTRNVLFENSKQDYVTYFKMEDLLMEMIKRKCNNPTFYLSFFDLFVQGLTNICRHLFFSMSLAIDIAEYNNETDFGLAIGFNEYEFLHEYSKFLLSQNLAKIDYDDYLIDWRDNEIVPTFHVPLTYRGTALINYIKKKEVGFNMRSGTNLISEMILKREYLPSDYQRLAKAKIFQQNATNQ